MWTKGKHLRANSRYRARMEREMAAGIRSIRRNWQDVRTLIVDSLGDITAEQIHASLADYMTADLASYMMMAHLFGTALARAAMQDGRVALGRYDDEIQTTSKAVGMNAAQVEALREQYGQEAADIVMIQSTQIEQSVRALMLDSINKGLVLREAQDRLRQRLDSLGLGPQKTYRLESLYRTHAQVEYMGAQWNTYESDEGQEIIWGYEYITVGDDRVRQTHAAMDGTKLPRTDGFWKSHWPPNGWNCRCSTLPVFEGERTRQPRSTDIDDEFRFNPGIAKQVIGRI